MKKVKKPTKPKVWDDGFPDEMFWDDLTPKLKKELARDKAMWIKYPKLLAAIVVYFDKLDRDYAAAIPEIVKKIRAADREHARKER